ncbi:MAG: DUF2490 domain-containing protein [Cryomorphaceae bacterium]|nr:DUF2490 domain-containing protein [Cryomorphaceae bacterium]
MKTTISILFFFLSISVMAQNQIRPESYGQWFMYFGDNKINDRWGLHTELQLRNYFLQNTVEQTLARLGANYYLNKFSMVSAGYGFIYTQPSAQNVEGTTLLEHRVWEQLILRHKTDNVFIEHRYRLEQRFIENISTGQAQYGDRVRYRLQALFPLYSISPRLRYFFINTYNEIFMNLGLNVSGQIFDRNRLYFAIGVQYSPKLNFQIGYLNQVISVPGDLTDVNHNLQIGVSYNLDAFFDLFN